VTTKQPSSTSDFISGRTAFPDAGILLARVWFGLTMAFAHGLSKVSDLSGFVRSVEESGIPLPGVSAPIAAFGEFLGGLLLALGWFTRGASLVLFGTMFVAAFVVHGSEPFAEKELALAYLVIALAIGIAGPGRYSVDAWWRGRRPRSS
jgi:putative oxidoreductase